jgi:hypothetical protein
LGRDFLQAALVKRVLAHEGHPDIEFLETMLIGMALKQNEELQNVRGTKFLREMRVPGIIRTGKGEGNLASVKALRDVLGIGGSKPTGRQRGEDHGADAEAAAVKVPAVPLPSAAATLAPNKRIQPPRSRTARG